MYILVYKVILLRVGRSGPKELKITMGELTHFHSYSYKRLTER